MDVEGDSVHLPGKVAMLYIMTDGFDKGQLKSLEAVAALFQERGGRVYSSDELKADVIGVAAYFLNRIHDWFEKT